MSGDRVDIPPEKCQDCENIAAGTACVSLQLGRIVITIDKVQRQETRSYNLCSSFCFCKLHRSIPPFSSCRSRSSPARVALYRPGRANFMVPVTANKRRTRAKFGL